MTWQEWKDEVERQLKEQNVPLDAKIDYIDWGYGYSTDDHDAPQVFIRQDTICIQ